ncbi:MAG: PqqD family protein [Bacteroidales bacterium]|nr:PqqD family protein [Bacteroidales bacterium]
MKIKENIAISESGFVFDSNTGDSYNLNGIGQEILRLLKDQKSEEDIQTYILNNYDTDQETVINSYYDFITMLGQFNLLENED